jgi:hypothetical protein
MHLFQIEFITNHASGLIETGKALLLADSHEQAYDFVCVHLNLPKSRTRVIECFKVKPPCHVLSNRQFQESPNRVSRPPGERSIPERYNFFIQVSNVIGHSEHQALRKIGEELQARGSQRALLHNLEISIDTSIEARGGKGAPHSALEVIEFYRPATKPMQGGRTNRR